MRVKYSDDESNGTPYNLNILLPFLELQMKSSINGAKIVIIV